MNASFASTVQMLLGLALVAGAIVAAAWGLRRITGTLHGSNTFFKPFASASVGPRERVVAVEAGDSWLILGVTAHTITHLQTLPKGEIPGSAQPALPVSFSAALARALKRDAR